MIYVTAVITIKNDDASRTQMLELLGTLIPATRKEDGCIRYDLHLSSEDSGTFLMLEEWRDKGDLVNHMQQPHFLEFAAASQSLLAAPFKIYQTTPVL